MFVQTAPKNKDGRVLMYYAESYRENGKVKQRTIERIGFVDEFTHLYDDPIAHFKKIAKEKTKEMQDRIKPITVILEPEAILPFNEETCAYDCVKNIGYAAISQIFHLLGINQFIDDRRKYLECKYNLTNVMKLLVFERILAPDSKRATWLNKGQYFDKMDFSLNDIYHALSIYPDWQKDLLQQLHRKMVELYDRDSTLLFYDVTNYYFEIDNEDDFRKNGMAKDNKKTPIVQMGLFMDGMGFPVTYDLFEGNTNDCSTFVTMSEKARALLKMDHIIYVADKAMMSGENVAEVITKKNGYIFSKSVRGATQKLKNITRDPAGYLKFDCNGREIAPYDTTTSVAFMYKVFDEVKDTYVKDSEGHRKSVRGVGHYQIIYWSAKYAERAKVDRQKAIEKAEVASHTKSKEVIDNNYGKNKYLKTQIYDKQTEKQLKEYNAKVVFDFEKLEEDVSLDGYYIIETNVTGLRARLDAKGRETDELEPSFNKKSRWLKEEGMLQLNKVVTPLDIIGMYRGLWKIEQTFRVTKSELEVRPVYVSRKDRINSHFLTCFIALLIVRILEHEVEHEFSSEKIINSLRKANVAELNSTTFKTLYYDEVLKVLREKMGIDFGRNIYTRSAIRSMLAKTKR
ncbi:MAG: IS1634 family transposase [Sphaerochaetaceae bacterium]|jgi:transposase|nr:IS1634 family transposase [Spirochaetales bacterium]